MSERTPQFEIAQIRKDFPILRQRVHGKRLAFLDNAASTQKPSVVIESLVNTYETCYANVHRGVYEFSQVSTDRYEEARKKVAHFIGAPHVEEVIFTKGTTESMNLIATAWGESEVSPGDHLIVTRLEHHSNFVPWQALAKRKGAHFKICELTENLAIDLDHFEALLKSGKPRIVSFSMMSNVVGILNPIQELSKMAKRYGALVVVDAAQGVAHTGINIRELPDVDFIAFSAHKMLGPSGVGVLWGRKSVLEKMSPYQYGGDMILVVKDDETTWNELPYKFEAGTPIIAGVIAFGVAIDYLQKVGMGAIRNYEEGLTQYALGQLREVSGLKVLGGFDQPNRGGVMSFTLQGVHPHDLGTFLDHEGVAIRAGHHCAQPLLAKLGIAATGRASLTLYNDEEDIVQLAHALKKAKSYFGA